MPTYKTAMTVLGLDRGETFSSDDPRWEGYVKAGVLTVVEEKADIEEVDDGTERGDDE